MSAFSFGLWVRDGPGGGFLPLVAGVLAIIFGGVILRENIQENLPGKFNPKVFLPIGALLAIVAASKIIGLILSIAVYLFLWLKFYEKESWLLTVTVTILCPLICYMIFVVWLKAPLPRGILGLL